MRIGDATYAIKVERAAAAGLVLDGRAVPRDRLADAGEHQVVVTQAS